MDNRKFNQDEYLDLSQYDGHPKSKENPKFSIFNHDGGFFFALLNNHGKAFMRSEGYANEKTRETGMNSVMNNSDNKERWGFEEEAGKTFIVLKAGNHKEIARSGAFNSKSDAQNALKSFLTPNNNKSSKNNDRSMDEYLPIEEYRGHKMSKEHQGFCTFTKGGEFYFGMADNNGKVRLRSQGYKSEAARDNGIQSVIKNKDLEKRWAVLEEDGAFFGILKAGNHQEIGRSEAYKDKAAAAWTPVAGVVAAATASASAVTNKVTGNTKVPKGKRLAGRIIRDEEIEDNYLATKFYEGHPVTDKQNNIAFFKHTNGEHYFAMYNKDGSVKLRSEGFTSTETRDEELAAAIKFHNNKDMYTREDKGYYYIDVLKDKTGREVGRTPLIKNTAFAEAAGKNGIATKAGASILAATAASAAIKKFTPVSYDTVSLAQDGDNMRVVGTSQGNVAGAVEVARNVKYTEVIKYPPGPGWLRFAWLPLLLLIPFLGLLFRTTPPVTETPPPPPPAPVVKKAVPPPPVIAKCKCSDLTHPIFVIPEGPAPKTTTALGRAPEYGNQHGKTPLEFFQKLGRAYKRSDMEKEFLNGIFKQMGYKGGFKDKDVTADLFTAVNVPRGVEGNLGTKTTHKTVYRKLDPTNAKDLKAFRIKAKNKCDLHFMKTCGNHFFFEECDESS